MEAILNTWVFTASWVVVLTVMMTASSYFSWRQNVTHDKVWFFATWAMGLIPMWALVSRYSRNIVADAVLYDTVITIVYYIALLCFTGQLAFVKWWQVLGFILAVAGTVLVKVK